ncbi:hypothetical protein GPJ56_004990 [Histomonas meleagridis]|uniref:uncharacterized protein n=1 Tax=Histomonas meleagridis TaxID=135588 RepID=UPI00355A3AC5|nr:hypothetical protein GPJ56_004990 [Histomonas meleagridis]KAH0802446.1 hypothetical protein GO595_004495 [Histomonas meleagridis]
MHAQKFDSDFTSTVKFIKEMFEKKEKLNQQTIQCGLICALKASGYLVELTKWLKSEVNCNNLTELSQIFLINFVDANLSLPLSMSLISDFKYYCYGNTITLRRGDVHPWMDLFIRLFYKFTDNTLSDSRRDDLYKIVCFIKKQTQQDSSGHFRLDLLFNNAFKAFSDKANESNTIFINKIPAEFILSILGDGVFVKDLSNFQIPDYLFVHISNIFQLFTHAKFESIHHYYYKNHLFSFGENKNSSKIGLVIHGLFGITYFEIEEEVQEQNNPEPEPEKRKYMSYAELCLDKIYKPFEEYHRPNQEFFGENKSILFMLAFGFSGTSDSSSPKLVEQDLVEKYFFSNDAFKGHNFVVSVLSLNSQSTDLSLNVEETELFHAFLSHLGGKFEMGNCQFVFKPKLLETSVLILFNESNKFLNPNYIHSLPCSLVITVEPLGSTFNGNELTYGLSAYAIKNNCILPIQKERTVVPIGDLSLTVASLCFFIYASISQNNDGSYECDLANAYASQLKKRETAFNDIEMAIKDKNLNYLSILD